MNTYVKKIEQLKKVACLFNFSSINIDYLLMIGDSNDEGNQLVLKLVDVYQQVARTMLKDLDVAIKDHDIQKAKDTVRKMESGSQRIGAKYLGGLCRTIEHRDDKMFFSDGIQSDFNNLIKEFSMVKQELLKLEALIICVDRSEAV